MDKIVLQKFISQSGFCSRRKAEELIRDGLVAVNGDTAELGMKVSENDKVKVGDKNIGLAEKKIYIKLNKLVGYTCTNRSFDKEKNVFELLSDIKLPRLYIVGRLDKNSRGLLLLTNDGELTEKLTHPRYEHEKEYEVEVISRKEGVRVNDNEIEKRLLEGVDIGEGDGTYRAKKVKIIGDNRFSIVLTEGKKRQIRRMLGALACEVIDLERVRIGSLEIGDLGLGRWGYLSDEELVNLKK